MQKMTKATIAYTHAHSLGLGWHIRPGQRPVSES
jgi:hypothetical protein